MAEKSEMHMPQGEADQLDVRFDVPFTHRVRFTRDVLGGERRVLLDVLEPSEGRVPKVQFWVDESVAVAQPDLKHKLTSIVDACPRRLLRAGNIQFVPGGEAIKNDVHVVERMLKVFNAANLDRRSYVVVVGGGAVLDAVGFAAAIAHRGIRLVRLPTTTLAQADSGIGVKNSINLFSKKNWVGTFAVPWAVVNDANLLSTLPDREYVSGFSEAVKVALLKAPAFFDDLCRDAAKIRCREEAVALPLIRRSSVWHLKHITEGGDAFEALEARPLDYGHWSAHKLEVMTDFTLHHGEAVGIGVAVDTVYSSMVHGLPERDMLRTLDCVRGIGMPLDHPALHDTATLLAGMEEFRQHLGGRLTLTMLRGVGDPVNVHEVDEAPMCRAIEYVAQYAAQHA